MSPPDQEPAVGARLRAVQTGYEKGREAGYREEARAFGEMAVSDVANDYAAVDAFVATLAITPSWTGSPFAASSSRMCR